MKKATLLSALLLSTTLLSAVSASAAEVNYQSNGLVEFIPNTDPTLPVDPTDPNPTNPVTPVDPTDPNGPNPGTQGPLSIDYASSFDFGINKITNADQTYYARAQEYSDGTATTPNYVQISDNRGTNAGWTLTVTQSNQFANANTLNRELTGAEIVLQNPTVASNAVGVTAPIAFAGALTINPDAGAQVVMSAAQNAGAGTWVQHWGTAVQEETYENAEGNELTREITPDVMLNVPGATPKDAVQYTTVLNWTLSEVPANGGNTGTGGN